MSVTVVVVDPAFEADAALGFGSELVVVEEFVCEGAVESFCFPLLRDRCGQVRRCMMTRSAWTTANAVERMLVLLSARNSSTAMSLEQNHPWARL